MKSVYPIGCIAPFSTAQKALAFFFFEAQSCIQDDGLAPSAPPAE